MMMHSISPLPMIRIEEKEKCKVSLHLVDTKGFSDRRPKGFWYTRKYLRIGENHNRELQVVVVA
ncbi:hypothetical protein LguiB_019989 [Lonicera macranthoides]